MKTKPMSSHSLYMNLQKPAVYDEQGGGTRTKSSKYRPPLHVLQNDIPLPVRGYD